VVGTITSPPLRLSDAGPTIPVKVPDTGRTVPEGIKSNPTAGRATPDQITQAQGTINRMQLYLAEGTPDTSEERHTEAVAAEPRMAGRTARRALCQHGELTVVDGELPHRSMAMEDHIEVRAGVGEEGGGTIELFSTAINYIPWILW